MKISQNYTQNQQIKGRNNAPTFNARLDITPSISKLNGLSDYFTELTKEVDGAVKLIKNGDFFNLEYINGGRTVSRKTILNEHSLSKNEEYSKEEPFRCASIQILANLDDMMAKNGLGYGSRNPFSALFNRLLGLS